MEGGGLTLTYISWYQNNLGGVYLRCLCEDLGLAQDQHFVIRVDTCDFPAIPANYPQRTEPQSPIPGSKCQLNSGRSTKATEDPLLHNQVHDDTQDLFGVAKASTSVPLRLPERLTGAEPGIRETADPNTFFSLYRLYPDDVTSNLSIPALIKKQPFV
ncbi:hypothetical protein B0T18DRAFT_394991 [Schizothecium vesticola]|uniref:Uncharacterized protein n=1 Tax=Schizothecium vesticola TaxID=314040 RepID=A0AA40BQV7_9PEZI|nr:hypothetical protein B0T18DRAFT_394991 [Schizothecium vesticola]